MDKENKKYPNISKSEFVKKFIAESGAQPNPKPSAIFMAGLPGASMPIGFSKDGLPIGMQIIGDKWSEATIYKFASYLEKELSLDLGGAVNE